MNDFNFRKWISNNRVSNRNMLISKFSYQFASHENEKRREILIIKVMFYETRYWNNNKKSVVFCFHDLITLTTVS